MHRKPLQGVKNIIQFNWHFYATALAFTLLLIWGIINTTTPIRNWLVLFTIIANVSLITSLVVSAYVYDFSKLYHLHWLEGIVQQNTPHSLLNVTAGFDETSVLIKNKFPQLLITTIDFYDPKKHTEISIKRARKKYPPSKNLMSVDTKNLPLEANSMQYVTGIFAIHEIRNTSERIQLLKELKRVLKKEGRLVIMEHPRDFANAIAYNIGALHFFSKRSWNYCFEQAQLHLIEERKVTPFVSLYILEHHGNSF